MSAESREVKLAEALPHAPGVREEIVAGAQLVQERTGLAGHDLLITLGSGLRDALEGEVRARIPLAGLPGVPAPAAEGHGGELLSLDIPVADSGGTVHCLVATGRNHLYEGFSPTTVVQLSRVAAMCGVRAALLTNAGGCLREWELGDIMLIDNHVNLSGESPFEGAVFVDIWKIWDEELSSVLAPHTSRRGVYAIMRGPEFQTEAESILLRAGGVDMVGMSTVMEAIALHQLGVRVCGLSVTSDLSFSSQPTAHEDVLAAARGSYPAVREAIDDLCAALAAQV